MVALVSSVLIANEPVINISGGNETQRENIRAHLNLDSENCELSSWRERTLIRAARRQTIDALQALGHYQPTMQLHITPDNDCWTLHVNFEPGKPVLIKTVSVVIEGEAANDPPLASLAETPPLREGDILRHDQYEQLKRRLTRLSAERGYFDSHLLIHRLEVDPQNLEATIELHLDSGPRYFFGPVIFEQQVLKAALINKFIPFEQGQPFENKQLLQLRQSLSGSGYFNEVRIRTQPELAIERRVPIQVEASPRPRYGYLAGIGFATDTGPRIRLGVENRRLNRHGHRYQTELEASPIRTGIGFNYEIPLGDPNRERVNLSTAYLREDTGISLSERYRVGAAHLRELDSGWLATRSLEFEREYFTVADVEDRTDLVMPGYELARTRANHPIYPTRGWRLSGKIRAAHEQLASSVSFIQFRGSAKTIQPLLKGRIIARVNGGATLADELITLPTSIRFFTGGDSTVRGFRYQSLGPKDDQGNVIGGRHMFAASLEYDYPLLKRWSLAAFIDGGNAYDRLEDFEPLFGVGIGIRWRSPIGPIRFDIARPSDRRDPFRIHISMGADL